MVDGVTNTTRVEVHQALHGYAEGHRQLAASISLKPRDAKTLLILSDISGPGARLDDDGYLTGYPLTDTGVYALAKTWPAHEMSRPGCVWTHTLLIDFADLAAVTSVADLLSAFHRPSPDEHEKFGKPVTLNLCPDSSPIDEDNGPLARKIVGALYGKSRAKIISVRSAGCDIESLASVIWLQQWPRLRRTFRFCTLSATDRSTEGAGFDLQFLPGNNKALRTRFPNAVDADAVTEDDGNWLDEAITDLVQPSPEGLRSFLRRIGGDIAGGRSAFRPLCQLYRLTKKFGSEPDALEAAIQLLEGELRGAPARAARVLVAAAALPFAGQLSSTGFAYLLDHLNLIESALVDASADKVGRVVLQRRPTALRDMLEVDGAVRRLAENALMNAPVSELLSSLQAEPGLALLFLQHRPQLAASPKVWSRDLRTEEAAFKALQSQNGAQPFLIAMMKAGRADLANRAIGEVGALEVLKAVTAEVRSGELSRGDCWTWLHIAAQPDAVAQWLSSIEDQPRQLLALLARAMRPDDVPNDYGEDPWLSALQRAKGSVSEIDETYLRTFLLARSLGWKSRNQAELAQRSFERIHNTAAANLLSDECWRLLDPILPRSILWFNWDRCQRLRAGIVDIFVERRLAPMVFGRLVQNEMLFRLLADQTAKTSSGCGYLNEVRRALFDAADPSYFERRRYIERLLK